MSNSSEATAIRREDLFSVGDLVLVDNELRAFIVEISVEEGDGENGSSSMQATCKVRYEIGGTVQCNIDISRIRVIAFNHGGQTRSGLQRHASQPPSAVSTPPAASSSSSSTSTSTQQTTTTQQTTPATTNLYNSMKDAYTASISYLGKPRLIDYTDHPLYKFLHENRNREKGWARALLRSSDNERETRQNNTQTHLGERGTVALCLGTAIFSGYMYALRSSATILNHAFDIHRNSRIAIFQRFIDRDFTVTRKQRSDKDTSVFTCDKKRKATFTAFNHFKRRRYQDFRETHQRIPGDILKREFEQLTQEQKDAYGVLAERDYERSKTLWDELKDFLLKTKGKIGYREMENFLGNIVGKDTIMRILVKQEGYFTRRDRILPALSRTHIEKRFFWAQLFWIFWKSVAACPVTKIQFVMLHMDEKWFYAVRSRRNCKVLTSIGLEGNDYYAHHKSHIGKIMYVVVTAFVPVDNDLRKGGKAIPVACVRVGKMKFADRDSYERVYNEDGSHFYPAYIENRLRVAGNEYFEGYELTGSSDGTEKDPKVSLLRLYKDQIIPQIEQKVVERFSDNGRVKVCIVKQEDGAGLHTDTTYQDEMREEFARREWILFNQPPQSPVTNVHDACIFPMMSKAVSKEQAMVFRSRLLDNDALHQCVMNVWENDKNCAAMSRAFAAHPQVVCAILENDGDNKYLTEKGGLSFGVRRSFVRDHEGDGVLAIEMAAQNEGETAAGLIVNERRARGLKYTPPNLMTLEKGKLTEEMIDILESFMEEDLMEEDVRDFWTRLIIEEQLM